MSSHIDFLKMRGSADTSVWEYAKTEGYIIVSKDNDFRQRSFLFGSPPKVIWLPVGNGNTLTSGLDHVVSFQFHLFQF